jgi:cytochrome c peroxidase
MQDLPWGAPVAVQLPGESRADTGHDLFHRDAGGGIACASCHPEGGEDGRTWRFKGTGERRTQALHVGLRDTAPFHWNGDLPGVGELMTQVFVGRMGGVRESAPRVSALSEWLFALKAPASIRDASDEAAQRGKALFRSADVGCNTCHSGDKLTDNQSVVIDTATNVKLQVPSLVAIGYRAPFMHNGCAATLADRFNPACGGDAHGNTSGLSDDQRTDLIAYLESL